MELTISKDDLSLTAAIRVACYMKVTQQCWTGVHNC